MNQDLDIAVQAARDAGAILLDYYKAEYEIHDKGYHNPVTTADHASDAHLKKNLRDARPAYGWLSEETVDDRKRLDNERIWVVDPLDGTKEFIEGVANFVVSIALVDENEPVVGVLYNPVTEELFTAVKGQGAHMNGDPVRCTEKEKPAEMVILNSRSETRRGLWDPYQGKFRELRAVGSVAYKLGLTAAGKADIFASLRPKNEWDICAGHCILREAGGDLVTVEGKSITYNNSSTLITPGLVGGSHKNVEKTLEVMQKELVKP